MNQQKQNGHKDPRGGHNAKFPGKQTKSVRLPVEYLSFAEDLCRFLSEKDESLDGKKIFKLTVINGRVFGFEEKL